MINTKNLIAYLDSKEGEDIKDTIRHDIIQINDLSEQSMGILIDVMHQRRINVDAQKSREELAMEAFLKYKDVFDLAHDRFCFMSSTGKISEHNMVAQSLEPTQQRKDLFGIKVREFFAHSAKGGNCIIRYHFDDDKLMIAIIRGSHKRSVSSWGDDSMKETRTLTYRPAKEDILEYNKAEQKLYIKASSVTDREFYITVFAEEILNDKTQASREDLNKSFDLSPLQEPDFRFESDEIVQQVFLLEAKIFLHGALNSSKVFKSKNLLIALKHEFGDATLDEGDLVHVKLWFHLKIDGKIKKVTFEIDPPNSTKLNRKKYAQIVKSYLERIGIKRGQISVNPSIETSTALV